jgi:hypothetical protein
VLDWCSHFLPAPKENALSEDTEAIAEPGPSGPEKRSSHWESIALYALGIVTGILLFAIYNAVSGGMLTNRGAGAAIASVEVMRSAARDGTLDAIATIQARANQPPTPDVTPTLVPATAFAIREANRLGSKDAPVVILEYSDFQ